MDQRPIGVFDSGVGGLSVVREIRRLLPAENIVYFADQANCPYGPRSTEEIRSLAAAATSQLLEEDVKLVVVACNTASTAALTYLREMFPIPFVGIVPAIKPACSLTRSGKVAVLATEATLRSAAFELLIQHYSRGCTVVRQPCPEFVELVEAGRLDDWNAYEAVRHRLASRQANGVDCLVLGCTHFEFLRPTIQRVAGPSIAIVGSAKPVALQTARVLSRYDLLAQRPEATMYLKTSGDIARLEALARRLLGATSRSEWADSPSGRV